MVLKHFVNRRSSSGPTIRAVFVTLHPGTLLWSQVMPDHLGNGAGEQLALVAVAVRIVVKGQLWNRIEQWGLARLANLGMIWPGSNPFLMPELIQNDPILDPSPTRVRLDPRVSDEVERKRPIGVSFTGWVNLLLQKAIASEPEPLPRD